MIPQAYIQAWRARAPWPNPSQVEQDLIICRALCDLFNAPALPGKIKQPLEYAEDSDLVQAQREAVGATVDATCKMLDWLGKCDRMHAGHSSHRSHRSFLCSQ